jgi:hypothetical protein
MKRKYRVRRIRRYAPVLPQHDVYLLTPKIAAASMGISVPTLARWRAMWKEYGTGPGPEPVYLTPRIVKYRIDDCKCYPGSTWLERLKSETANTTSNNTVATGAK